MANLAKVLKTLDKQWKDTEAVEVGQFTKFADGNYVVTLEPAGVELSKTSERLQIAWPMVFAEGKYEGKKTIKFDGLDSELSISWAKGVMNVLGIEVPDKATDLPEALETFFEKEYKDRKVNISIKTDGDFSNIFINGYVEEEEGSAKKKKKEESEEPEEKEEKKGKKVKDIDKPTKKEVKAMSRKELKAVIKEHGFDIDPDEFEDTDDLKDAVIEEL